MTETEASNEKAPVDTEDGSKKVNKAPDTVSERGKGNSLTTPSAVTSEDPPAETETRNAQKSKRGQRKQRASRGKKNTEAAVSKTGETAPEKGGEAVAPGSDEKKVGGSSGGNNRRKKRNTKTKGKTSEGKTESIDHNSTMVRPSLRILIGSAADKMYIKPLKQEDVVIVPEMFGKEGDLTIYEKLVSEVKDLQNNKVKAPWHRGSHMIVGNAKKSITFQEIVDKLCEYFDVQKNSIFTQMNWYQDSKDWKGFQHGPP